MSDPADNNDDRLLSERSLAFFGAITASVSHELNNVVSIIEQTAGLLDDLLYGAKEGRPIENERLQRIADGINQQTARGVQIIGRFNFFAHTVDHPATDFELNKTLDNLVGLCGRFADMRQVKLESRLKTDEIGMKGNPFNVQQVIFLYIKRMLSAAQRDDTIAVSCGADGDSATVTIEGAAAEPEEGFDTGVVELLTGRLGASLTTRNEGERLIVRLMIPRTATGPPA
jgi:C4-dicarboxylate-specific signal transduction histidine kinase